MISERAAKAAIFELWRTWAGRTGTRGDKRAFYDWLVEAHPHLLTFPCRGSRWEQVNLWLFGR